MDISVTINITELKFSVWILKVRLKGKMSQIFDLGPSFYFMTKKGNFLSFFAIQFSTFHKMKTIISANSQCIFI